jgi:hypothetical protein
LDDADSDTKETDDAESSSSRLTTIVSASSDARDEESYAILEVSVNCETPCSQSADFVFRFEPFTARDVERLSVKSTIVSASWFPDFVSPKGNQSKPSCHKKKIPNAAKTPIKIPLIKEPEDRIAQKMLKPQ